MLKIHRIIILTLSIISLLTSSLIAQNDNTRDLRSATVDGYAFLQDQSDHSGIAVIFTAQSPSAVTDTFYTNSAGYFAAGLSEGLYSIKYEKEHYVTIEFTSNILFDGSSTIDSVTLQGPYMELSGELSGTLDDSYKYLVVEDIVVQTNDTLIITSGAELYFSSGTQLNVFGYLNTNVVNNDSILFASIGGWDGIHFNGNAASNSVISFSIIQSASINCDNSSPTISNNRISNSGNGIYCNNNSSPIISNNFISNNTYGIYCNNNSSPIISNNTISENALAGVYIEYYSSPIISNNTIINNTMNGVFCQNSISQITNNIISNNNNGIQSYISSPSISNNTITENYCGIKSYGGLYGTGANISDNIIINNTQWGIYVENQGFDWDFVATIQKNLISNNLQGIYLVNSHPNIINNTISNSRQAIQGSSSTSDPAISSNIFYNNDNAVQSFTSVVEYNLFWQNPYTVPNSAPAYFGELLTINANGDSCDIYNNLFIDPLFVNPGNLDFHLTDNSPCIDAGNADTLYYDPDNTISDIGAFYFDQGSIAPSADFTSDVLSGNFPLVAQFTNESTGPITEYSWNFGDNESSSIANPVHVYSSEGIYSVSLTVTGPGGVDTEVKTDYITVTTPHYPPEVSFSASPTTGITPLTVNFSSTVVNDLDSLRWFFGDGGTSAESNPTYIYQSVGTYTVILYAYGPYGTDTETKTDYINVIAPDAVSADFSALPLIGTAPMGVQFTNNSVGTIDSVRWYFGDGNSSTDLNPAYEYQSAGVYTVLLNVYGPVNDDSKTKEDYITVYDARPIITDVSDVPNDQGGKVFLRWSPSGFDGPVGSSVNQYSLWQAYGSEWISINNTLATQSDSYTYLASTYSDSTTSGIGWSRFKIIAHTSDPTTFYTSPVDSGYSIDNIPPEAPGQLLAVTSDNDVYLEWGVSNEPNFMYYKVFRNWQEISEQTTSQYMDTPDSFIKPLYYQVVSVDDAGNESPGTNEALVDNTNLNWYVNIRADHGGEYNDNDNFLGVADDATNEYDVNYDIIEPPFPPNGYVGLYFPHPEWSHVLGDNFTQDIKPSISLVDTLQVWNFDIIDDNAGTVELSFEKSSGFPPNATIILKNLGTGVSYLIEEGDTVVVTVISTVVEHFSISIGNNTPTNPENLTINNPSISGFSSLTWTDNSEIEEGYIVKMSTDGTNYTFVDSLETNANVYNGQALGGLDVNSQYFFSVCSYNLAANSSGIVDSSFTLSSIPSAPILSDSTLTTIEASIDEDSNPIYTKYALGISGGNLGETIHYVQQDGYILGDTTQSWAVKSTWGNINIMGLEPETEYTVKVKSRNGDLVESQFGQHSAKLTGSYPVVSLINPHGPAILRSNTSYTVTWEISNQSFVDSVFLYYSPDSGASYSHIVSMANLSSYSWTTPSEYLVYGGLIKVSIKDESGRFNHDVSDAPFVLVGDSLANPIETGWTLWGAPLIPTDTSIVNNLADDFSSGWWSFSYEDGGYHMNEDLSPGSGYWIATDAPAVIDIIGVPQTTDAVIDLPHGWALVTNPLITDVSKDSIQVTNAGNTVMFPEAVSNGWVTSEFYHYSPSIGGYEMPLTLNPWKGYWLGIVDSSVTITFPIHKNPVQVMNTKYLTTSDPGWRIKLITVSGSARDWVVIGADSSATDEFDIDYDVPKPPTTPNPNRVEIAFNHPSWNPLLGDNFIVDIRAPITESTPKEWDAQIESTIEDSLIEIFWELENVPDDLTFSIDYNDNLVDLLEQQSMTIPFSSEVSTVVIRVVKSPLDTDSEHIIPFEFALHQNYPNPFNPVTTLRYDLPKNSYVRITIYDLLGRQVKTLINQTQDVGFKSVIWNATNDHGKPVSAGVYIYQIRARLHSSSYDGQAGEFVQTKKMVLLK